jgi:hypothetical protein
MRHILIGAVALAGLAGCAPRPAPSPALQAETAACTAQANAQYDASTVNLQARTSQNGVLFAPNPNHVFDAEQLGALNQRQNSINDCLQNGNDTGKAPVSGGAIVTPHIVGAN